MGMLGLSLIFVGIALTVNGVGVLMKIDRKSCGVVNFITAGVLIIANVIGMTKATYTMDYVNSTSGLLFGVTYLLIGFNNTIKFDLRPFGIYCGFVAIYATAMGTVCFMDSNIILGCLWIAWAILWAEAFIELLIEPRLAKVFPYLSIAEGIFAAFIPALLMLLEII